MIYVVVGTSHLSAILGYCRGQQVNTVLQRTLNLLVRTPSLAVKTKDDLAEVTVFEVLKKFHNQASPLLQTELAEVMTAQRDEIVRVARQEYHYPDFEATIDDACHSVAIHGLFPHGTLTSQKTSAFLPDFSLGVRCIGYFAPPPSTIGTPQNSQEIAPFNYGQDEEGIFSFISLRHPPPLPSASDKSLDEGKAIPPRADWERKAMLERLLKLECHLCDTLRDVYDQAEANWKVLQEAASPKASGRFHEKSSLEMPFRRMPEVDYLVLDALVDGFQGHRSLRRDNPEVPALGTHRLLAAKATRQGIGKPVVSGLFPITHWRDMESPVRHFILNAAEKVGAEQCPPLYPNMPSDEDMQGLYGAAASAERGGDFEVKRYAPSLRKLGIEAAVRRRIAAFMERPVGGKWAWDWTRAIFEYESALYDDEIEQSLQLQDLLDLYPLHKRVLGLIEYIILPGLEAKGLKGNASGVWTQAFTGEIDINTGCQRKPGLSTASWPRWPDKLATLETEGNWLIHAAAHEAPGETGPIDRATFLDEEAIRFATLPDEKATDGPSRINLADLLEKIVTRMSSAGEVTGVSVSLHPETPQVHARQLGALADRSSDKAACMTLYLGKVALMLRNAVEHGTDRVERNGLRVDTAHYWEQNRAGKPILNWLRDPAASRVSWRSSALLPAKLPSAANAFLLTPASLHRCLVLLTLVMHGGFAHLGI